MSAITLSDAQRDRFDELLQHVLDGLPPKIQALVDEVPIVVLDRPTPEIIKQLIADGTFTAEDDPDELCGLHSGTAITDRSIDDPVGWGGVFDDVGPEQIHLFRVGIVDLAGGFDQEDADEQIAEEIRITILHEIGHHYGLDEDDLDKLGYA
jgi:predicted Zn-dependent protease with MMP-like domain